MDKPKMPKLPEPSINQADPSMNFYIGYHADRIRDLLSAHHAAWEAYVAKLRDMVLAAVPTGPEHFYIGIDEVEKFRAETIANINALFDKENTNER